jgi:adenylate cyclase
MQLKTRELKRQWEAGDGMPIQIRIGINTGDVVVGNMGSSKRLEYSAIGANVNLAQRLESGAPVGGVLVTKSVYDAVKDQVRATSAGTIKAKGFSEEVEVYEVALERPSL